MVGEEESVSKGERETEGQGDQMSCPEKDNKGMGFT